nr:putative pentatricopeptide repeat-containing protein At1g53330 [Ipomoea batatas]
MEKMKKVSPFRLSSLIRLEKDPKLALQLFLNPNPGQIHNASPIRYSILSYDRIICKLGRAKMFDEMETILEKLKEDTRVIPKEVIFCNVISFYGRARMPERAIRTFHRIPDFRCPRTMKSANSLLSSLLLCREFAKMEEIISCFGNYGCPDVCTYNILINACCILGDLTNAWNVFDEMRSRGPSPNVITFGTLINGLCSNLEMEKAIELKECMIREFKLKPNAYLYAALIKGLCKDNKLDVAITMKEEMLKKRVELDSAIYATLISAFFKNGRKDEVQGLLEEMNKNECKCDTVTYNAMIHGLSEEGDFDSAFGVLNQMQEQGAEPDVISYNVIIRGLCKKGKFRDANELFEDMPRRKCTPDVVTYRILFDGLCDGMQFQEATLILDEMVFKGLSPRPESTSRFITGLVQGGDMELLLRALNTSARGNLIGADVWRLIISTVCKEDKLFEASEIVSSMACLFPSASSSYTLKVSNRQLADIYKEPGYMMACPNAVLLVLMVLLASHAIPMESRKVMKMEASLMTMNALPKGDIPPSSPSDKGHDNGDSTVSGHGGLPSVQSHVDRNLESVPSPTIGN